MAAILESYTGKAVMEDATIKEPANNLAPIWPKTPVFPGKTLIIDTFKSLEMIPHTLIIWGSLRLAGPVNPWPGGIGQFPSP